MATKVITGKCRASVVHIFEPQSINGSDPKYSISLIIPKSDTKTITAIQADIDEAVQNGITSKWGGKRPPTLKPEGYAKAHTTYVNGNRGVGFGLSNLQFWSDGTPLTSRVRAEDEFDALDAEDDDDFLN